VDVDNGVGIAIDEGSRLDVVKVVPDTEDVMVANLMPLEARRMNCLNVAEFVQRD